MVMPMTQLLGIGFGQNGSTSNLGACFVCADVLSIMRLPCTQGEQDRDKRRAYI